MEYDDILNANRPAPSRAPMSLENRAAQFAPFSALTGYEDAIDETARLTSQQVDMADDLLAELSYKLNYAMSSEPRPEVTITYFRPDKSKSGGSYAIIERTVIKSADTALNILILNDSTEIPLDAIADIRILRKND